MKGTNNTIYTGDVLQNQFTAYAERALYNNRISYFRKYKAKQKTEIPVSMEDERYLLMAIHNDTSDFSVYTSLLQPDNIRHEELAHELRNISEKDFTIIRLRILYGYTYKKIGYLIGMKEEAVRVRYFRTIQKMRDNMKGENR